MVMRLTHNVTSLAVCSPNRRDRWQLWSCNRSWASKRYSSYGEDGDPKLEFALFVFHWPKYLSWTLFSKRTLVRWQHWNVLGLRACTPMMRSVSFYSDVPSLSRSRTSHMTFHRHLDFCRLIAIFMHLGHTSYHSNRMTQETAGTGMHRRFI